MAGAFVLMAIVDGGWGWLSTFILELIERRLGDIADRPSGGYGVVIAAIGLGIAAIAVVATCLVVSAFTALGYTRLTLRVADGKRAAVADIFSCRRLVPRVMGAWFVYLVIVIGGLVLLVVPGIIWAIRFQFFAYAIVDEDAGVLESLRRSSAITRGETLNLLGFWVVCALISLAGLLPLFVGALLAYPTVALADAYEYRRLCARGPAQREAASASSRRAGVPAYS